jgi:transcriptional regulator of acetoin/glycerol metabolism
METGQMPTMAGFTPDPAIVQSWERCGGRLDPRARPYLTRAKEQALETTLRTHADLLAVAVPHLEAIHQFIEGSDCAILLADGTACVLIVGGDQSAQEMIAGLGLGQGTYWAEGQLGTTALGLVWSMSAIGQPSYLRVLLNLA